LIYIIGFNTMPEEDGLLDTCTQSFSSPQSLLYNNNYNNNNNNNAGSPGSKYLKFLF